jgi:hypothetical protein
MKVRSDIKEKILKKLDFNSVKNSQKKLTQNGQCISLNQIINDILVMLNDPKEMRSILKDK